MRVERVEGVEGEMGPPSPQPSLKLRLSKKATLDKRRWGEDLIK